MTTPTSVAVSISQYAEEHCISWKMPDARYHYWTVDLRTLEPKPAIGLRKPTLYKNPLVDRGQPEYFETRRLDASKPKNVAMIADVKTIIDRDLLVEFGRARLAAEIAAKEAKRVEERRLVLIDDAALELYEALKAMVLNDAHPYRDCHKAAQAALARAEGRS